MSNYIAEEVIYIKSNQFEPTEGSNPHHDVYELVHDGKIYKRRRKNKGSTNWLCKQNNCEGSVTISFRKCSRQRSAMQFCTIRTFKYLHQTS